MGFMEKEKVRVLAIQMESIIGELNLNIGTVHDLIIANLNKYNGADIVILPEVWTAGWCPSVFKETAETLNESKAVHMLSQVAEDYGVTIIGGSFIRKDGDKFYNTCPVIGKYGQVIGLYDKNHLYSYYGDNEGEVITRGDNLLMVDIYGVKIGLSICYDIRFPEVYRTYRRAGADILVNMAAWGKTKKIPWDTMTRSRAIENQAYMIALTQTGLLNNGKENLGHSMIIDYEGKIMDEIEEIEGGIYAELNIPKMYEFREKCTILKDEKDSYEVVLK